MKRIKVKPKINGMDRDENEHIQNKCDIVFKLFLKCNQI